MKIILTFGLFVFLALGNGLVSYASEAYSSQDELPGMIAKYDQESLEEYLTDSDNIKVEYLKEEPEHLLFTAFDVNKNGDFAVLSRQLYPAPQKELCVYSGDGAFKYGFKIGSYKFEHFVLHEDSVSLFYTTGSRDIGVTYNSDGELIRLLMFAEGNTAHYKRVDFFNELSKIKKSVDDDVYQVAIDGEPVENESLFSSSDLKTEIVLTDSNGNKVTLYEAESFEIALRPFLDNIVLTLFLILLAVLLIIRLISLIFR